VVYWWLVFRGLRLVKENELQSAVLCYAGGTLALSLGLGILLPIGYALTTIVALLPVVIAVTYANRQTLLRVILLSTVIVGIGAFFTWLPPLYEPGDLRSAILIVAHTTVVILVVQVGLSVWASHGKLGDVIEEMREANRKLRESERTLEHKVTERTAELAERNRELEASESQLAKARDSAMQASQAKSAFLANMSHELRTPLNAIIGYSEMLQEEAENDGNQSYVPDLDKILTSGRYLLSLINGVLDLSKIEAGKMDVYVEAFDVADVVRGIEAWCAASRAPSSRCSPRTRTSSRSRASRAPAPCTRTSPRSARSSSTCSRTPRSSPSRDRSPCAWRARRARTGTG
jgi:signal transduction histidine kinase